VPVEPVTGGRAEWTSGTAATERATGVLEERREDRRMAAVEERLADTQLQQQRAADRRCT